MRNDTPNVPDRQTAFLQYCPVPLHAFDRFTGADRTRTTGSTGLSVAVVDTLTHRNQGTVTARDHPDRGAEVSIQLPAAPSPPTREERFSLR
ncbi:ATP-binding protein [Mycobacterium sp. JS623]|uniref:ATP-binding protein n=1 Tax=Mycobacterium sp. JS623 TaxID=212767 RepID=UPI000A03CDE0|nr:ATP-binding protein [Mycobacterium sp. JS623]